MEKQFSLNVFSHSNKMVKQESVVRDFCLSDLRLSAEPGIVLNSYLSALPFITLVVDRKCIIYTKAMQIETARRQLIPCLALG